MKKKQLAVALGAVAAAGITLGVGNVNAYADETPDEQQTATETTTETSDQTSSQPAETIAEANEKMNTAENIANSAKEAADAAQAEENKAAQDVQNTESDVADTETQIKDTENNAQQAIDDAKKQAADESNAADQAVNDASANVDTAGQTVQDAENAVTDAKSEKDAANKEAEEAGKSGVTGRDVVDASQKAEDVGKAYDQAVSDEQKKSDSVDQKTEEVNNKTKEKETDSKNLEVKKNEQTKAADTADAAKNEYESAAAKEAEELKKAEEAKPEDTQEYKNLTDAEAAEKAAEDSLNSAKEDATNKNHEISELEKIKGQIKGAADAQQTVTDNAKKSSYDAETEKNQAQKDLENAKALTDSTAKTVADKQKTLEDTEAEKQTAAKNLADAKNALTGLEAEVKNAQDVFDSLKKQKEDQAKGSYGLFAYLNDQNAMNVFTTPENDSNNYADFIKYTNLGKDGDATSIENLKKTLAFIRECNELRKSEGKEELKITNLLMAQAEADANYSANIFEHAKRFPVSENIAYGSEDPYEGWYTMEKFVFEHKNDANFEEEFKQQFPYYSFENYKNMTGHYRNIINSNYHFTGYGICTNGTYYNLHAQTFYYVNSDSTDLSYTVDEYESLLNKYIATLVTQDQIDQAQTTLDNANKAVADQNALIKKLTEADNNAASNVKAAEQDLENAKAEQAAVPGKISEAEAALSEATKTAETKLAEYQDAQEKLDNLKMAHQNATAAVEKAQGELSDLQKIVTSKEQDLQTAKANLETAQTAYDNLDLFKDYKAAKNVTVQKKAAYDKAVQDKEAADQNYKEALDAYTTATSDLDAATSELDTLKKELTDAQNIVTEKLSEKQAAEKKRDEIKAQYDAIVEANKKAAAAAENLKNKQNDLVQAQNDLKEAQANLEKAKENADVAADKKSRADALDYDTISANPVTDPDFMYLNSYFDTLKTLNSTLKDQQDDLASKKEIYEEKKAANEKAQKAYLLALADYTKTKDEFLAMLPNYHIIAGAGSQWTIDSTDGLMVAADGDFKDFNFILVDGEEVDKSNYEAHSGSTYVTLKPSYLNKLKEGKHTLTFVYDWNTVDTDFTILPKAVNTNTVTVAKAETSGITSAEKQSFLAGTTYQTGYSKVSGAVPTGDGSNVGAYIAELIAAAGFMTITWKRRKKA